MGTWTSQDVLLRISREGGHGEHYIVEWKDPSRMARGSFDGPFRDDAKILGGDPLGDVAYSSGKDILIWRGKRFSRVSPEEYARAAPQ